MKSENFDSEKVVQDRIFIVKIYYISSSNLPKIILVIRRTLTLGQPKIQSKLSNNLFTNLKIFLQKSCLDQMKRVSNASPFWDGGLG
jgi:hypothetical protein